MSAGEGRRRIREAAAALFGERGYHDVTVREIADAAAVSPGLVIKLFGSKAELYTVANPSTGPLVEREIPRELLGRALVRQVVNRRDAGATEPWATLVVRLRQSPAPEETRREERELVLGAMARIIGDATPDRRHAAAVSCQLVGLAEGIRIAGYFDPEDIGSDDVVDLYAAALQHHIDRAGT